MADEKISAMPAAAALGGTELIPIVQTGANVVTTPAATNTYVRSTMGTGVSTAISVNVGTAGSFVVNGGALGTPSSGVATNLTGTAAGLTAGTVTTNANLTGDVTSSGNATTLATVNSNVGSFTSANITVNAKGLVTAAANGSGGSGITIGTTAITSGTATRLLYETSGNVVGEISGATSNGTALTLVAPVLGTPASGTLTNCTGLPAAGVVGTAAILGANTFTSTQTIVPATNVSAILIKANASQTVANPLQVYQTSGGSEIGRVNFDLAGASIFIGAGAGSVINASGSSPEGRFNSFVGALSGSVCTTGSNNAALGTNALAAVTTGLKNVAIGSSAGLVVADGFNNTLVGYGAAALLTSGVFNTIIGSSTADSLTTGTGNTFVGLGSGTGVDTGGYHTHIGYNAGVDAVSNVSNTICIGQRSRVTGANMACIGSNATYGGTPTKLGINLDSPAAWLHLPAGTTTVAPFKFTSGTNETTAEAGAMEYNGTNLFFTRSGTTREGVLTQSAVTTEVVVSDTTVTVNIGGTTYKLLARA